MSAAIEDSPEVVSLDLKTELNKLLLALETTMFAISSENWERRKKKKRERERICKIFV